MDYYEFLQISPNAEEETIHRVYRFLAARFHPDNPESGNAEQFATLTRAYEVLSVPGRRAKYDATRQRELAETAPLSNSIDFMDQMEGETNRRMALMAVLYYRRRSNPNSPEVTLAEVETRMGFPRDYLDFTTWYLQKKGYITRADNSDFTLTAEGVDFVETQRASLPVLNKLLTPGQMVLATDEETIPADMLEVLESLPASAMADKAAKKGRKGERRATRDDRRASPEERRVGTGDRRQGKPDLRANPIERRVNIRDRRRNPSERRGTAADRRTMDSVSGEVVTEASPSEGSAYPAAAAAGHDVSESS